MRIVLQIHGLVGSIKADNAPSFIKGEFELFCKKYDIELKSITPGNAQANLSERQHSQVNHAINMSNQITEKITLEESKEVLFDFVIGQNLVKKRATPYCPLEILKGQLPAECTKFLEITDHEQPRIPAADMQEEAWLQRSKAKLAKTPNSTRKIKFSTGTEIYWRNKTPTNEVQYRKCKVIDSNETSTCLKLASGKITWIVNKYLISKPDYEKMLGL